VTHAYLGQWYQPMAHRRNVTGVLQGPATYLWNIEKAG
jgi:peptide/nickel transport system substrate-binding protein